MKFVFDNQPSLEVNKTYPAIITSASVVDEDTDKERVLVNVRVDGFRTPAPASYNTSNETGSRMLSELLSALNYDGSQDFREFLKGKTVNVRTKANGEYINTSVYAPSQQVVSEQEELGF